MQSPTTPHTPLALDARGVLYAGRPESGSHHSHHRRRVHFGGIPSTTRVSAPAVGLVPGDFAMNIARVTTLNGTYSSTTPSILGPWKCMSQASSGQGHGQSGTARVVSNPQAKVQHWQMGYTSPLSGNSIVAVQLHGNIHIRASPNRQCTYQCTNYALPVVVNAICDNRYQGWGHVTLPNGSFCWVQLQLQ